MGTFQLNVPLHGFSRNSIFSGIFICQPIYTSNIMAATGGGKGSGLTKPMKVSADLADVIGTKEASRAQCIKLLWKYLKEHNLQDSENKQYFFLDKKMGKIFGTERIRAFGMAKFLGAHLTPI